LQSRNVSSCLQNSEAEDPNFTQIRALLQINQAPGRALDSGGSYLAERSQLCKLPE